MAIVKPTSKDLLPRLLLSLPLLLLAHCTVPKQVRQAPASPPVREQPEPPSLSPEELLERFNLALDRA